MTGTQAPEAAPDTAADIEAGLAARVIETLLREDYAGLSRHVRGGAGGMMLAPGGPALPYAPAPFVPLPTMSQIGG